MPPIETQPSIQPQMTPEEAKASLGIATHLQQSLLMPKMSQEAPITPNSASGEEFEPETENTLKETESRLLEEIATLKEEIKKLSPQEEKKEIDSIREELETLLADEETNEQETED